MFKQLAFLVTWGLLQFGAEAVNVVPSSMVKGENFSYRRPLPELPRPNDPAIVNDTFTLHLYTQIHAPLFQIDELNRIRPQLVESFEVAEDQLSYRLKIKPWRFHTGRRVTADDVKMVLENAIARRAISFESLRKIQGFDAFVAKQTKKISGIVVGPDELSFRILLSSPDPELVTKLTDSAYSIWNLREKDPLDGLGPYRITKRGQKEIVLERFLQPGSISNGHGPNQVYLLQKSTQEAIAAFKKGEVDDLFAYSLPKHLFDEVAPRAHVQDVFFPRTYFFAVNARRIQSREVRETILRALDRRGLIKACYPSDDPSQSLVPPGYLGHHNTSIVTDTPPKHLEKIPGLTLKIMITESIGSETCVRDFVLKALGRVATVSVRAVPLSEAVKNWRENSIEGLIAYMDAERTAHYFGPFRPAAEFPYGDPSDQKIRHLYSLFDEAQSPAEKNVHAQQLADHILAANTFASLFHPEVSLIYQRRFKRFNSQFQAASLMPIVRFELEKGELSHDADREKLVR